MGGNGFVRLSQKDGGKFMKKIKVLFHVLLLLHACCLWSQEKQEGALIMISKEGEVGFFDADGTRMAEVKAGGLIPRTYTIVTGANSQMVGLLSNGTLVTLVEKTKMRVKTFDQEPFDPKGKKLKDLEEEPSVSKVELELDIGSLIVSTKKLDRHSIFDIRSSLGAAGIRGTEFQMALDPSQGVQLDVTESIVAFTPPGGGQPIAVSEGRGLSVSPTGAVTQRPVNPTVARQIATTIEVATLQSEDLSLNEVSNAMEQAANEADASAEENPKAQEDSKSEPEEEAPREEREEGGSQEDAKEQGGEVAPASDREESNSQLDSESEGSEVESGIPPAGDAKMDSGYGQGAALENNAELSMARKTGKVDEYTKSLAQFGLSEDQTLRFYSLSPEGKSRILREAKPVVARLLAIREFGPEQADIFFRYAEGTREKILGLENGAMVALINQRIDEDLLAESLTKMNLEFSKPGNLPRDPAGSDALEKRKLTLGEDLIRYGNEKLMDELVAMSGGSLSEEWLEAGELAVQILRDKTLGGPDYIEALGSAEVFGNTFYTEVADLYKQLELDFLVSGDSQVIAAKNLLVLDNAQALTPYFGEGAQSMVLSASEDLEITGDLNWEVTSGQEVRLIMMSAGKTKIKPGANLSSVTSDLVISSREHLTIEQVKMEVAQELAIRSLRDLELKNVTIGANALATIKARRDLNVDGLTFNRDVSRIVMEATTMRLRNVDFPAFSTVQLNSLKGGIDGRYPNFGTAIPAASQIGRVNFIENVKSGGNLIMNRASFDQFGQNINIGKINRP